MRGIFDEDDREDLIAYLDGELDDEHSHAVEARLQTDPKARAEAESLKRAWELLDFLPRAEPSPNFTQRTLDRIPSLSTAEKSRPWARVKAALVGVGWAAALLLFALGGYAGFNYVYPGPPNDAELIRDLRLLENKPLYDNVEDLEFLKELDHPDLFGDS
jgi:hypothetical protein